MKILIITNLFPNHLEPDRGIFNKQQFQELKKYSEICVVAPLPWYPKLPFKTSNSVYANIKSQSLIDGMTVYHPRFLVIPKLSQLIAGTMMYWGIKKIIRTIKQDFAFDAILSTWAYPDCYAAYLVSKEYQKKLFCKVHGSDINVLTQNKNRSAQIVEAFKHSQKVIAVTTDLKNKIIKLGLNSDKISVIPNGVDLSKFYLIPQDKARGELKLDLTKKYVLFIGHLTPIKGIEYLIRAMKNLPEDTILLMIGEGPEQSNLEKLILDLKLNSRVLLLGKKPHDQLVTWFNAANIFCLPSLNEGCPNVLLEAFASGKFVVASNVGGIPELVKNEELGLLVKPRDPESLQNAIETALIKKTNPEEIRKYAQEFIWEQSAKNLFQIISQN